MSAANLSESIANFKAAAGSLRAFVDLADKLDSLGDVELAEKEIGGVLASKQKELAALDERIAELKVQAEKIIDDAKAQATEAVENARASAEKGIADAKINASSLLTAAREDVDAEVLRAEQAKQAASDAEKMLEDTMGKVAVEEAKLAKARSKIADLLNG